MLSASAYSFKAKSRLAISLSWVGGYVNTVALLICGETVSHMTGNTTHLGQSVSALLTGGPGAPPSLLFFAFVIFAFLSGAASSGLMTETARLRGARSKFILPMTVEALLLTAFALVE